MSRCSLKDIAMLLQVPKAKRSELAEVMEILVKEGTDTRAKEILSLAIQRCAADHVAEATVSVVPLPK